MGYQNVRALTRINHDGVDRIPGQTTGKNAQDFVVNDATAQFLVGKAYVTSLGVAKEPRKSVPMTMSVGQDTGASGAAEGEAVGAVLSAAALPPPAAQINQFDAAGNPLLYTDALGRQYTVTWGIYGWMTVSGAGQTWTQSFDSLGRAIQVVPS